MEPTLLTRSTASAAVLLLLAATGCNNVRKPTPAHFETAINNWFNTHDDCLYQQPIRFPYEVSTTNKSDTGPKGLDALASAKMLTETAEPALKVKRYEMTPVGAKATARFCYGHRVVTSIDSFTPPGARDNRIETDVSYHYKLMDVPTWTSVESIQKAFPKMAKEIADGGQDKITLMEAPAGWQVPD